MHRNLAAFSITNSRGFTLAVFQRNQHCKDSCSTPTKLLASQQKNPSAQTPARRTLLQQVVWLAAQRKQEALGNASQGHAGKKARKNPGAYERLYVARFWYHFKTYIPSKKHQDRALLLYLTTHILSLHICFPFHAMMFCELLG